MAKFTKETARQAAQKSAETRKKAAEDKQARKVYVSASGKKIPHGRPFTKENAAEMGRRGTAAQKRRRELGQVVSAFMDAPLPKGMDKTAKSVAEMLGEAAKGITWAEASTAAQMKQALKGDSRAYKVLAELEAASRRTQAPESAEWSADYAQLIAEPFLAAHRRIWAHTGGQFWFYGGRASTKSSCISLEIVGLLMSDPELSALVTVKAANTIREGVYRQMAWALDMLGVTDQWEFSYSPMQMVRKATGQAITFRGCDKAAKSKGLTAPLGTYYGVQWFEEVDQLAGMEEVRTVTQSATRGAAAGAPFYRFYSFNPPRTRDSWANVQIEKLKAEGEPVYRANYCDVPPEWLSEQLIEDAHELEQTDPESYRHEWLGEAVGYGNEVFERVEVRDITAEEVASCSMWLYGVDWGFSRDPFCWVRAGYVPKTRTLYIVDEFHGLGLSNAEAADEVKRRMAGELVMPGGVTVEPEPYAKVMCDSAEPKSIADFKGAGIAAEGAPKTGAFNVRNSTKWLQQRAHIVINPACELAAREFQNYSYVLSPAGEPTGMLPDADNHAIDAMRYAASILINDTNLV